MVASGARRARSAAYAPAATTRPSSTIKQAVFLEYRAVGGVRGIVAESQKLGAIGGLSHGATSPETLVMF